MKPTSFESLAGCLIGKLNELMQLLLLTLNCLNSSKPQPSDRLLQATTVDLTASLCRARTMIDCLIERLEGLDEGGA